MCRPAGTGTARKDRLARSNYLFASLLRLADTRGFTIITPAGDLTGDGVVNVDDIDRLSGAIRAREHEFDLTGDGVSEILAGNHSREVLVFDGATCAAEGSTPCPREMGWQFLSVGRYGFMILMLLIFTGVLRPLWSLVEMLHSAIVY